jgi:hypothetical protein
MRPPTDRAAHLVVGLAFARLTPLHRDPPELAGLVIPKQDIVARVAEYKQVAATVVSDRHESGGRISVQSLR